MRSSDAYLPTYLVRSYGLPLSTYLTPYYLIVVTDLKNGVCHKVGNFASLKVEVTLQYVLCTQFFGASKNGTNSNIITT